MILCVHKFKSSLNSSKALDQLSFTLLHPALFG